jgi:membrane protein implicated in regulation of membrane protease activity
MHVAPKVGANTLIGATGKVIGTVALGTRATHLARVNSETWLARTTDELSIGDSVVVMRVDGLRLVITLKTGE